MSEKRHYFRERSQGAVQLTWTDSMGVLHTSRGECVDISQGGLRVELRDRIELRTVVQVKVLNSPPRTATVRYCDSQKLKFILGVEFLQAVKRPRRGNLWVGERSIEVGVRGSGETC